MKVQKESKEVKEYQYNKLLSEKNHLIVAKAQYILKIKELWENNECSFDFFKQELNNF